MRPTVERLLGRDDRSEPEHGGAFLALWNLCTWYAGAVRHHQDPTADSTDHRQLPDMVLHALENLSDDILAMLGRMVRNSLALGSELDELRLARQWVEDVRATVWRILIAEREDFFGRIA
ncbi:hypothetical protein [Frankia gtarii]|uniref:hypothetical protein n=1 Tax=Frankia gtarii TaxID=2950102 RepID=UPI0021BF2FFE|nr:hypothetical protein [Frankia gtarii]